MNSSATPTWLAQQESGVRFDWGAAGAKSLASPDCVVVVVDVLSFSTAVSVAVTRGIGVLPLPWGDESAAQIARDGGAVLAAGRRGVSDEHPWSLSPAALLRAPVIPRLLLPSPDGSAIATVVDGNVVAGCLRNAGAVASWLVANDYGTPERPVIVVAAGERWPDGSLRPCVEDLLGAGAILSALGAGEVTLSAEAQVAAAAYVATPYIPGSLRDCASGRELAASGFADDVEVAASLDADDAVPLLQGGTFLPADG